MSDLGIGSVVWVFDVNHRVYAPDGRGAPIYREHFRPMTIIGDTGRSWLAGHKWAPIKINKKTLAIKAATGMASYVYPSAQAVEDACWVNAYAADIARAVNRCRDAMALRLVAECIGWHPPGGGS